MAPRFTVDWEDWFSARYPFSRLCDWKIVEPTEYLLKLMKDNYIKGAFYCLGTTMENYRKLYQQIVLDGHWIYDHGYEHVPDAQPYNGRDFRKPFEFLHFTGGFWFRFLPYWLIKRQVLKHQHFYIHPHDIMLEHPKTSSWWLNLKRNWGLKGARKKLERLVKEVYRNRSTR